MAAIRKRKSALKDDIQILESGFENRVSGISRGIKDAAKVKNYVVKHPFISVAAATGLGIIAGTLQNKKRKGKKYRDREDSPSSGLTSLLFGELKHIAARKAAHYFSDFIDQQISSYQNKSDKDS